MFGSSAEKKSLVDAECEKQNVTQGIRLWLDILWKDIRYGVRTLRQDLSYTIIVLSILALGIGMTTGVFSTVNGVMLRPLPYRSSGELVDVYLKTNESSRSLVAYPTFLYWQREAQSVVSMGAWADDSFDLTTPGGAERVSGRRVTANFFTVFGVKPLLGKTFDPQDDHLGANPVVLISEGLWRQHLSSSTAVLGKIVTLNGEAYTIIGIIPAGFHLRSPTDIYVPVGQSENPSFTNEPGEAMQVVGRLKRGVTLDRAEAALNVIDEHLASFQKVYAAEGVTISSLHADLVGNLGSTLLLLLGAVGFVLLITCVNVSNLTLVRAYARRPELAIRCALGASRSRIIRELLTEAMLLSITGGVIGILLAELGTHSALVFLPNTLPDRTNVGVDDRVLAFALAVSLITSILIGLIPALRSSDLHLQDTLKEGRERGVAGGQRMLQKVFIVLEISLALILLTGAGLMIRSMQHLWAVNLGYNPQQVVKLTVAFPSTSTSDTALIRARDKEIADKLLTLPGTTSVSVCMGALPLTGESTIRYWPADRALPASRSEMHVAQYYGIGPGYFRAMEIAIEKGRSFDSQDNHSAPLVAIVDRQLAARTFPNEDPIGEKLNTGVFGLRRIVGVVGHVKQFGADRDSQAAVQAQIYVPFEQVPDVFAPALAGQATFVVRASFPSATNMETLQYLVSQVGSDDVVYDVQKMTDELLDSQSSRRFATMLLSIFAAVALLLVALGVYGIISYLASQRAHEIGIRMALGAQPRAIFFQVIGQAVQLALVGITIGLASAIGLTRTIRSLLFGIGATDPIIFGFAAVFLFLIVLAGCYIPARRLMRVDPMVALRYQ